MKNDEKWPIIFADLLVLAESLHCCSVLPWHSHFPLRCCSTTSKLLICHDFHGIQARYVTVQSPLSRPPLHIPASSCPSPPPPSYHLASRKDAHLQMVRARNCAHPTSLHRQSRRDSERDSGPRSSSFGDEKSNQPQSLPSQPPKAKTRLKDWQRPIPTQSRRGRPVRQGCHCPSQAQAPSQGR